MAPKPLSTHKSLFTRAEFDILVASTKARLESFAPERVRSLRDLARRLRDKFRGLAERQQREARGKAAPRARQRSLNNENTRVKQRLFAEAVERFERALGIEPAKAVKAPKGTTRAAKARVPAAKPAGQKPATKGTPAKKPAPSRAALAVLAGAGGTGTPASAGSAVPAKAAARASRRQAKSAKATPKAKGVILAQSGVRRVMGHLSSQGRRDQGRRDAR